MDVMSSVTELTLKPLVRERNYTINITTAISIDYIRGGNCFDKYLFSESSNSVYAVTTDSRTYTIYCKIFLYCT